MTCGCAKPEMELTWFYGVIADRPVLRIERVRCTLCDTAYVFDMPEGLARDVSEGGHAVELFVQAVVRAPS